MWLRDMGMGRMLMKYNDNEYDIHDDKYITIDDKSFIFRLFFLHKENISLTLRGKFFLPILI